jgi:hypothetical protein
MRIKRRDFIRDSLTVSIGLALPIAARGMSASRLHLLHGPNDVDLTADQEAALFAGTFRDVVNIYTWQNALVNFSLNDGRVTGYPIYGGHTYSPLSIGSMGHGRSYIMAAGNVPGAGVRVWMNPGGVAARIEWKDKGNYDAEAFAFERHPVGVAGVYAIKAFDGHYVTAEPPDHRVHIVANRNLPPKQWEQFRVKRWLYGV